MRVDQAWREKVYQDASQFNAMLSHYKMKPALDRLRYYSNWVSPLHLPSRFDTHFFIASVKEEECLDVMADGGGTFS